MISKPTPFRITDYGAVDDGKTMNTAAIQTAIETCAKQGGGTVLVPKGTFLTGGLHLRSNVTLRLEKDAVLLGSSDCNDYGGEARWTDALVKGEDVSNIAIEGEGTLDGVDCRNPKGEERFRGPHCVLLARCKSIRISNITIVRSANWAFNCIKCSDAVVEGLKVYGGHDGFDTLECNHFTFKNCDFRCGDDCLAGQGNRDFLFEDCYFNTSCNAFRFSCVNFVVRNSRFRGPGEFVHKISSRRNMIAAFVHFSPTDRLPKGPEPHSDNWLVENCTMENVDAFYEYNYEKGLWQTARPAKAVHFRNVRATGLSDPITIRGGDDRQFSLLLENIDLEFREESTNHEHINANHFHSLELRNVVLRNNGQVPMIIAHDGDRVTLSDVQCVPATSAKPFDINDVADVTIVASQPVH